MVLFLPCMDNCAKGIEQRIEWMPLISTHFINQAVESLSARSYSCSFRILSRALTCVQDRRSCGVMTLMSSILHGRRHDV